MAADRAIDDQRFVAPTEQMAEELVPPVAAAGVGAQKRFHSSDQIRPRRLDHQMKMIRQEDVGVEPASRSWRPPREGFDEVLAIHQKPNMLGERARPQPNRDARFHRGAGGGGVRPEELAAQVPDAADRFSEAGIEFIV